MKSNEYHASKYPVVEYVFQYGFYTFKAYVSMCVLFINVLLNWHNVQKLSRFYVEFQNPKAKYDTDCVVRWKKSTLNLITNAKFKVCSHTENGFVKLFPVQMITRHFFCLETTIVNITNYCDFFFLFSFKNWNDIKENLKKKIVYVSGM